MYYWFRLMVLLLSLVCMLGCRYPDSQVRTVEDQPRIVLHDAPAGSILYVDGIQIGSAREYGPKSNALILEPGTHQVIVRTGSGTLLLEETIFLGGSELKTLRIR